MSVSVVSISDARNMVGNSSDDARIAVPARHTMSTAIGMLHVLLSGPCDHCKFRQHPMESVGKYLF